MAAQPDPTLTHALLAKSLGVTVTTVKSYRRKFPEFFQVASHGKPIRFRPECLDVCRRVREHFRRGLSVEEARKRLAEEFPAADPPKAPAPAPEPTVGAAPHDHLARIEGLLEGLFGLQNRTHSLLAELVSKLDTLADRLGDARPAQPERRPGPAASGTAKPSQAASGPQVPGQTGSGTAAPRAAMPQAASGQAKDSPAKGEPAHARDTSQAGPHPPAAMLEMPVVVRSPGGDYLGVTSPTGRPFTLAQFEEFLARRLPEGGDVSRWLQEGDGRWTLRLGSGGKWHDHHFEEALTPRGNTVARFASLSVDGTQASEAALQAFLRHVKESFAR